MSARMLIAVRLLDFGSGTGECVGLLPAIVQLANRSRPPISGFESKIGGALRSRPRSQLKAKVGDCKRPLEGSKVWLQ